MGLLLLVRVTRKHRLSKLLNLLVWSRDYRIQNMAKWERRYRTAEEINELIDDLRSYFEDPISEDESEDGKKFFLVFWCLYFSFCFKTTPPCDTHTFSRWHTHKQPTNFEKRASPFFYRAPKALWFSWWNIQHSWEPFNLGLEPSSIFAWWGWLSVTVSWE